jgi:hypothetical protein
VEGLRDPDHGLPQPRSARRALAEGFDLVLEKPLRGSAIADAVSRLTAGESTAG